MAEMATRDDDLLIGRWIDGERSPALQRQLEQRLLEDPAFRRRYQLSVATEHRLRAFRPAPARRSLRLPRRSAVGRAHRRRLVRGAIAAVGLAAIVVLGVWGWPSASPADSPAASDPAVALDRYQAVPAGEVRTIELTQGGSIELQGGSRFRLAGTVDEVRLDLLSGHAGISVTPDRGTRLQVVTSEATVSVLGTRFSVMVADAGTEVAVSEGRVQLTPRQGDTTPRFLARGDQLAVAAVARIASDPTQQLVHRNRLLQAHLWAGDRPHQDRIASMDLWLREHAAADTITWCATPALEAGSYRLSWPDPTWSVALPRHDLHAASGSTSLAWTIEPDDPGIGPIVFRCHPRSLQDSEAPLLVRTDAGGAGPFRRRPAVLAVPGATVAASSWIDPLGRFDPRPLDRLWQLGREPRPIAEVIALCRQWPVDLQYTIATDQTGPEDWQPVLQRLASDLPSRTRVLVVLASGEFRRDPPSLAALASWMPVLRAFRGGGPDRLQVFVPLARDLDVDRWLPRLAYLPPEHKPDGILIEAMHAYLTDTPDISLDQVLDDLDRRLPGHLQRLDERQQSIRAAGFRAGTLRTGLAVWPHEHASELQAALNRSPTAQRLLARMLAHLRQRHWTLIRSGGYNPLLDKVLKDLAEP